MKSSRKVVLRSGGLTAALELKYRGLVTGQPQRLVLWLPGHRSPAHNVLTRSNRWKTHALREEAQRAVLNARTSSSPSFGSGPSMPNPKPLP